MMAGRLLAPLLLAFFLASPARAQRRIEGNSTGADGSAISRDPATRALDFGAPASRGAAGVFVVSSDLPSTPAHFEEPEFRRDVRSGAKWGAVAGGALLGSFTLLYIAAEGREGVGFTVVNTAGGVVVGGLFGGMLGAAVGAVSK